MSLSSSTHDRAAKRCESVLTQLYADLPLVTGSLVASVDGRALVADLDEERQPSTAAITASSFALAHRLAEVGGGKVTKEVMVHHEKGNVSIFAVGTDAALIVLSVEGVNLGMLRFKCAQAVEELSPLLPFLIERQFS